MQRTRLSRLHPYPAMVADGLAIRLSEEFVRPGMAVFDPFCGSGRFLAASAHTKGVRRGTDVNPLACLVAKAKLSKVNGEMMAELAERSLFAGSRARSQDILRIETNRSVSWFSDRSLVELSQIVRWINKLELDCSTKVITAAALSATVRDVSYARKSGWKLHRMAAEDRVLFNPSAWSLFARKLAYCADDISRNQSIRCSANISLADARIASTQSKVDVILTSPPYGDSRTTVQYGAASELSLQFVSKIKGLESFRMSGSEIDRTCLGCGDSQGPVQWDLRGYWAGSQSTTESRRVERFLRDFEEVCNQLQGTVRSGGRVIFVVARRSTGGFRVKLDDFARDQMIRHGFVVERVEKRAIEGKRIPNRVNRFARAMSESKRSTGIMPSMREEFVLVFRRPGTA
jgi:site-specific DNA-methyltransferase (cytosine-N4-specific)